MTPAAQTGRTCPACPQQGRMDAMYRVQRYVYDATRKYYLLGRDRLLRELAVRPGEAVLEMGCGTGRNLRLLARMCPGAELHGLDVSAVMLDAARQGFARDGRPQGVRLVRGAAEDASCAFFGRERGFDAIFFSYVLSMIPAWEAALEAAVGCLAPGGRLYVADFWDQSGWPAGFPALLRWWLARFHVTPRLGLPQELERLAERHGLTRAVATHRGGYAVIASLRRPGG